MRLRDKYVWQAFEVEDINRRENYVFEYNPYDQAVNLYDTSRGVGKKLKNKIIKDFPFECETAYDYFKYLYEKSLRFESDNDIYFLGWVHPDTIHPLTEIKKWKISKEIYNYHEVKGHLRQKHKEFCRSIKDWEIRKLFRKHAYIAGGAVASLIKGEEPKDYDYFFDDKKVLSKVLKYYIDKHNEEYSELNGGHKLSMCADGVGVDLFLNTRARYVASDEIDNPRMNPVLFSHYAISFPNKFQVIIDYDTDKVKCPDRFDFVHTMGYFHPYQNKLAVKEETLAAIKENKLIYNMQGTNPVGSAKRLLRFVGRGWKINNKEHMKLLKKISHIDHDKVFDEEGEKYFF